MELKVLQLEFSVHKTTKTVEIKLCVVIFIKCPENSPCMLDPQSDTLCLRSKLGSCIYLNKAKYMCVFFVKYAAQPG